MNYRYPRRFLIRSFIRILGRLVLPLVARIRLEGMENLPKKGPVILAGNHVAYMEIVLMVVYAPCLVELIGTGDIPMDPNFAWLAKLYGFIPINRGNLDRAGLVSALGVLKQNGVLGIFPEGGIWQPGDMAPQTGVAWLSSNAHAPIVPIGFVGMRGALAKIGRLQRPQLEMHVGKPLPPISLDQPEMSKKQALEAGAREVMHQIHALLPEEEIAHQPVQQETYRISITAYDAVGNPTPLPMDDALPNGDALSRMLNQPVIMDVYARNLKLPVKSLMNLPRRSHSRDILTACKAILNYLDQNTGFLTYRFGMETGLRMRTGLEEMKTLADWAARADLLLEIHLIPLDPPYESG